MAKEKWQQAEDECVAFLERTFKSANITFDHKGGSDSSQSDIKLLKNNIQQFYIEAKSAAAQCGQFVVLDQNGKFVYSPRNKVKPASSYSMEYIKIMQANYDTYKACGTAGSSFDSSHKQLAYNWVKDFYKRKKTKYMIVEKVLGVTAQSNFIIFPLEKFDKYFDISATYRIKTSGSNSPNSKDVSEILAVLRDNKINVVKNEFSDGHYYVHCSGLKNKQQLKGPNFRWQFNMEGTNLYQVRKLSNTNNANVIFGISLKPGVVQDPVDLLEFTKELN